MAYNDAIMNSADKQKIAALGEQWKAAQQAGNQGGMNEAHEQAELIRKKYGYSGGGDGSGFKIARTQRRQSSVCRRFCVRR